MQLDDTRICSGGGTAREVAAPSMNFVEEKKAISCFGEPASAYYVHHGQVKPCLTLYHCHHEATSSSQ
eukprot:4260022-Prymnesium_polylepis.1